MDAKSARGFSIFASNLLFSKILINFYYEASKVVLLCLKCD